MVKAPGRHSRSREKDNNNSNNNSKDRGNKVLRPHGPSSFHAATTLAQTSVDKKQPNNQFPTASRRRQSEWENFYRPARTCTAHSDQWRRPPAVGNQRHMCRATRGLGGRVPPPMSHPEAKPRWAQGRAEHSRRPQRRAGERWKATTGNSRSCLSRCRHCRRNWRACK